MDRRFIDAVSTSDPTPGGGAASAYAGALASALASMVGELTIGKPRYADVQDAITASLYRLVDLRNELFELSDEDAEVFELVAEAYRMPSGTTDEQAAKEQAMQSALLPATEVPLRIMQACVEVLSECALMAEKGSRMAVSDAGACAAIAKGALFAASMNVWVNLKDLKNTDLADDFRNRAAAMLEIGSSSANDIMKDVLTELGSPDLENYI